MIDLLQSLGHFVVEWLLIGVIWKVIVAHALADYIIKWANAWLDRRPERRSHYESLLHYHRTRSGTL